MSIQKCAVVRIIFIEIKNNHDWQVSYLNKLYININKLLRNSQNINGE